MDFSQLELRGEDAALVADLEEMIATHVTQEVRDEVLRTGCYQVESFYRALGERGWLFPARPGGGRTEGLTPLQCELIELILEESDAPRGNLGETSDVLPAVEEWADQDLVAEILPRVLTGEIRFSLGYTEPDCGSDIAAAKTRATRDGDEWIINGSKMFTTGADYTQYCFLLARTDREAPKHKGLTMFLMPLDSPGIELSPIMTVGNERAFAVYYNDVRISDRYRVGEVNDGWRVLLGPLNREHFAEQKQITGLSKVGGIGLGTLRRAFEKAVEWGATPAGPDGRAPMDDPVVRERFAQVAIELEAATSTPDPMGRVYGSEACIRGCAELLNLVGPAGALVGRVDGAVAGGVLEQAHRFGQGTAIYAGSVEVFRNIIAQHELGLPRALPAAR